jgi:hypothetical protein
MPEALLSFLSRATPLRHLIAMRPEQPQQVIADAVIDRDGPATHIDVMTLQIKNGCPELGSHSGDGGAVRG